MKGILGYQRHNESQAGKIEETHTLMQQNKPVECQDNER